MSTRKIPNHPNANKNNLKGQQNSMATTTIPHLPILVIRHVLQFLPTKHAIRMSSLCKKWAGLWSSVPILDFAEEGDEPHAKFINFVDRCLEIHEKYEHLDKFWLCMMFCSVEDGYKFDKWLGFAVEGRVKELDISFNIHPFLDGVLLLLPLLNVKSITSLNVENVTIANRGEPISLLLLKTLSLTTVRLKTLSVISSLISGCPCIQYLSLTLSPSFDYYNISLQTLLDAKSLTSLNLESVMITDDINNDPHIGRLPCLKTVSLTPKSKYCRTFAQLISSSPSLEHLSVSLRFPHDGNSPYNLLSSSLKSLEVTISNSDGVQVSGSTSLESCTLVFESLKQIKRIRFDHCKNLKHLSIRALPLPNLFTLQLHGCKHLVNASLDIPKLN